MQQHLANICMIIVAGYQPRTCAFGRVFVKYFVNTVAVLRNTVAVLRSSVAVLRNMLLLGVLQPSSGVAVLRGTVANSWNSRVTVDVDPHRRRFHSRELYQRISVEKRLITQPFDVR